MNERITYNPEMKRIHEYRKRLVEAINYKGNADHEDVPSILCEFQEEIIKEHTDKVVEQLEQIQNFEDRTGISYCPDRNKGECSYAFTDRKCTYCAFDKAIEIVKGGTA